MKKQVFIILIILIGYHCFGQEKEQPKNAFTYSAGITYNQIWLQRYCYATDEYGISSSPNNWGVTPYFVMTKSWLMLYSGINYSSCSRTKKYYSDYYETLIHQDKWQETSMAWMVGFRVTREHQWICVTSSLGFDISYLIKYEKNIIGDNIIQHYDTDELCARRNQNYSVGWGIPIPFGISLLGGIGVSCPIAKHFEIGLSYNIKFKIINDIRNTSLPRVESITSPVFYHNANLGISYRLN